MVSFSFFADQTRDRKTSWVCRLPWGCNLILQVARVSPFSNADDAFPTRPLEHRYVFNADDSDACWQSCRYHRRCLNLRARAKDGESTGRAVRHLLWRNPGEFAKLLGWAGVLPGLYTPCTLPKAAAIRNMSPITQEGTS
jgi:hypothetical protein